MSTPPSDSFFTKRYRDGVYIPSGLLVIGTLIVKREWVPYAVALAVLLSGYKIWSDRKHGPALQKLLQYSFDTASKTQHRSPKGPQAHRVPRL